MKIEEVPRSFDEQDRKFRLQYEYRGRTFWLLNEDGEPDNVLVTAEEILRRPPDLDGQEFVRRIHSTLKAMGFS